MVTGPKWLCRWEDQLSALVALIPIFFFVALAVLRLKGHVAGAITLILSILIAIFAFKMPIDMAFAAAIWLYLRIMAYCVDIVGGVPL